jgi:hypothetical protein
LSAIDHAAEDAALFEEVVNTSKRSTRPVKRLGTPSRSSTIQHLKDWPSINLAAIEYHYTRLFAVAKDWQYRIDAAVDRAAQDGTLAPPYRRRPDKNALVGRWHFLIEGAWALHISNSRKTRGFLRQCPKASSGKARPGRSGDELRLLRETSRQGRAIARACHTNVDVVRDRGSEPRDQDRERSDVRCRYCPARVHVPLPGLQAVQRKIRKDAGSTNEESDRTLYHPNPRQKLRLGCAKDNTDW